MATKFKLLRFVGFSTMLWFAIFYHICSNIIYIRRACSWLRFSDSNLICIRWFLLSHSFQVFAIPNGFLWGVAIVIRIVGTYGQIRYLAKKKKKWFHIFWPQLFAVFGIFLHSLYMACETWSHHVCFKSVRWNWASFVKFFLLVTLYSDVQCMQWNIFIKPALQDFNRNFLSTVVNIYSVKLVEMKCQFFISWFYFASEFNSIAFLLYAVQVC